MTSLEKSYEQINLLHQSLEEFDAQINAMLDDPSAFIRTHFNKITKGFNSSTRQKLSASENKDIVQLWEDYCNGQNPKDYEIRNIIRRGLSSPELEGDEEFKALLTRQTPSKSLMKKLYTYVVRFQATNPDFDFKNMFWINLLVDWGTLKGFVFEKKQNVSTMLEPLRKKLINDPGAHIAWLEQVFNKLSDKIELKDSSKIDISVMNALQEEFDIAFYKNDAIYNLCLTILFSDLLTKYEHLPYSSHLKLLELNKLLTCFCDFNSGDESTFQRFFEFWDQFGERLVKEEKQCLKSYLLTQLGDPRLKKQAWFSFQILNEEYCGNLNCYKAILYWFNEADFKLFFQFAFEGKPDPHGRSECWSRYLPYAEDLKIFLPNKQKCMEFQALAKEEGVTLKPYLNGSRRTAFVIKIEDILIYEVVETGHAAYVYNLKSKIFNTQRLQPEVEGIKSFVDFCFGEENNYLDEEEYAEINTEHFLRHTVLADDGKNEWGFKHKENWRFTHGQDLVWIESVRNMMRQLHKLSPYEVT